MHELTNPEIIEEIQTDDGNMRFLTKEEAPELVQLFTFSRGASIINSDINLPKELKKVDLNNIMEVYDESSNSYFYSLRGIQKKKKKENIYNFIVKKDSLGRILAPQLILFEMDATFAEGYYTGEYQFVEFDGRIKQIRIKNRGNTSKRCSESEICDDIAMTGGSNGGDSGSTSGSDPGGISSGGNCEVIVTVVPCTCENHYPGETCTCSSKPYTIIQYRCDIPFETICEGECPPIYEQIPVNFPDLEGDGTDVMEANTIADYLNISTSGVEYNYFINNDAVRGVTFDYIMGNATISEVYNVFRSEIVPFYSIVLFDQYFATFKYLKSQGISPYNDWSQLKMLWEAAKAVAPTSSDIHTGLDVIGLLPVIGEAADFANAIFYVFEGDGVNASISMASTVPFLGSTASGSRLVVKTIKYGNNKVTQAVFKNNNIIYFAKTAAEDTYEIARSTFRKVMQTPSGFIAHHVISHSKRRLAFVQKAARSGKFHINDVINGFNIDKSLHTGYDAAHRLYDDGLEFTLNEFDRIHGHKSYDEINVLLTNIIDDVKQQLATGKSLDQVTFLNP